MKSKPFWRSLVFPLYLISFTAAAQTTPPVPQLDQVVVTASRTAQLETNVLGDVTVIDNKELQQAGQSSMAEILARHHGIQTSNNGGPQTATGVGIRGSNASQTLVLVDGIRINGSTAGSVNWNTIDPATIDHVEVIRGAASSLYGTDAIGGVINIITRKPGEDRPLSAFANMGYGTYDTYKSSLGLSGASGGWDYSVSSSVASSNGFSAMTPPSSQDADGYSQHSLAASLGYRWKPGHHIGITAYNGYSNGDFDVPSSPASDPAYAITRQQIYSATSTDDVTDSWQSIVRFGFNKDFGDSRQPGFSNTYGSLQRSYSWQNDFKLNENQHISMVLERLEERTLGSTAYSVDQRNTNAVGLIYRADFGRNHLQASARNDTISGYGNEPTGGLAYDFDLNNRWRIGVAGSTGFKAPTFADLYYPSLFGYAGNPNLKPEKSRNTEFSLKYETDTSRASAVVYQNKIRDLISVACLEYDAGICVQSRPENVDSATIRGITISGQQRYSNTTLRVSADFRDSRNDANGNQLRQNARQTYRFGADQRMGQLSVGAEYMFTGKRFDDAANMVRLGGYSLWNLTASYDITQKLAVQIRWNNVLNKDYATIYGYNTPGSNVFVNLAWRL